MAFRLLRRTNPKLPSIPPRVSPTPRLPPRSSPLPPLFQAVRWMSAGPTPPPPSKDDRPPMFAEIHKHISKMEEHFNEREKILDKRKSEIELWEVQLKWRQENLKEIEAWEKKLAQREENLKEWEKNHAQREENLKEWEKNLEDRERKDSLKGNIEIESWGRIVNAVCEVKDSRKEIFVNFIECLKDLKEWEEAFKNRKGGESSSSYKVIYEEWEKNLTDEELVSTEKIDEAAIEVLNCWEEMRREKGREFWKNILKRVCGVVDSGKEIHRNWKNLSDTQRKDFWEKVCRALYEEALAERQKRERIQS